MNAGQSGVCPDKLSRHLRKVIVNTGVCACVCVCVCVCVYVCVLVCVYQ